MHLLVTEPVVSVTPESNRFENENVWLTQALMAELFQTTPQNFTLHLIAIYEEGELEEAATCKDSLQVQIIENKL